MANKYLVSVETKNYPVNLTPIIQRYSQIKKQLTKSEIGTCLMSNANVVLFKFNGTSVKLTRDNFSAQLSSYDSEILGQQVINDSIKAEKVNREELDKLIESAPAPEPVVAASTPAPKFSEKKQDKVEKQPEPVEVVEEKEEELDEATRDNEAVEVAQSDPEDPDTYDFSHFSDTDE